MLGPVEPIREVVETDSLLMGLLLQELEHSFGAQLGGMEARQILEGPADKIELRRLVELQITAIRNGGGVLDERLLERILELRY